MWWGTKRIYMDYASATPPLPETLAAMHDAEKEIGNPGGIHTEALGAQAMLTSARDAIAHELGCKGREVIFTSGLTESINLAILGFARALQIRNVFENTHWIVSGIEHAAVLESFAEIERLGGTVTHVYPDADGVIAVDTVMRALRPETVFISIGWANNEIGVVQPIRDISRALKEAQPGIVFHTDAGQAPLYLPPQVHSLGVDLMSLGSNKLYGPHGVGALYVGTPVALSPLMRGGGQERGLRSGTENVALAAGFAEAFRIDARDRAVESTRLREIRDACMRDIQARIPGAVVNGEYTNMLPHFLNISIPGILGEYVVLSLDRAGIALSTKSACAEGGSTESHVVKALGPVHSSSAAVHTNDDTWRATNTLRFSFGRDTTARDCVRMVDELEKVVRLSATF